MKKKEIITYIVTIVSNLLLSLLLNLIIFGRNTSNILFVMCGVILFSLLITNIVAQKWNYKLDIFSYEINDIKYLILNSIFIGNLFSIPIAVFASAFI